MTGLNSRVFSIASRPLDRQERLKTPLAPLGDGYRTRGTIEFNVER
jgi:hypothetical protein